MNQQLPQGIVPHFILEQYQQRRFTGHFQAATLFVDLSGFTPLTEALMRHQKDGAEALANALRAIFTPLIAEVYQRGGIIPLFAGDAFTAIFIVQADPEHEEDGGAIPLTADHPSPASHVSIKAAVHAAKRAKSASQAIQSWLHGDGRTVQTPYGDFAISATAGLSFGKVQWGIPGRDQVRTFYFRGEAIDGCANAEHQAEDGQVFADETFLGILSQEQKSPNFDLLENPDRYQPQSISIHPGNHPLLIDSFIHASVLNLTAPAEFRDVASLFLSFQEPDSIDEMHAFLAEVMSLAEGYGGIINQLDFGDMGGYLLILFGAPISHENDIERAAEFLLALRQQSWSIPWRAGLDYGTVWAGIRGGNERNEYGVAGNVVILACRLFLKAPWGEVWTSEAIHRSLQNRYIFDHLGRIPIKGRSRAQSVYRLLRTQTDLTAESTIPGLFAAGIVGREEELAHLHRWVAPLFKKISPGVMIIEGEAGIGKSRLVKEWRKQLQSKTTVEPPQPAGVDQLRQAQPALLWLRVAGGATHQQAFGPFRATLRRLFQKQLGQPFTRDNHYNRQLVELAIDTLIESLPNLNPQEEPLVQELERTSSFLAALVGVYWEDSLYAQVEPQLRFENMLTAIKTLLNLLALLQPLILNLEDLHWFDDDSRRVVESLARELGTLPIAIVGTTRPADREQSTPLSRNDEATWQKLDLGYLSGIGVKRVAQQVLQGTVSTDLIDFLVTKTRGNPFFVEQLALNLLEQNALSIENPNAAITRLSGDHYELQQRDLARLPATISGVLIARLDRLAPSVKEVVQSAAILGREFESALLAQMLRGQPNLFEDVRQAHLARIWQPVEDGERYLFEHDLLRDAAYDMQLRSRLRGLHVRAAEAIERVYADDLDAQYATLAYHYDQADRAKEAVTWYARASHYANKQSAVSDAFTYISRAVALVEPTDLDLHYQLLLERVRIAHHLGDRHAQRDDLARLSGIASRLNAPIVQAQVALEQACLARAVGQYGEAIEHLIKTAQIALRIHDNHLLARIYHEWGQVFGHQGDYPLALEKLSLARSVAHQINDRRLAAKCQYELGRIYFYQAAIPVAAQWLQLAQAEYQAMSNHQGEAECLFMLGNVRYAEGRYDEAQGHLNRGLTICKKIGWKHGHANTLECLGACHFDIGRYADAQSAYTHALALSKEVGDPRREGTCLDTLGLISARLGNLERGIQLHEAALALQRSLGYQRDMAYSLTHLGNLLIEDGQCRKAKEYLMEALDIRQRIGEDHVVIDTLTGLANLSFHQATLHQTAINEAVDYVDAILAQIDAKGTNGVEFPIFTFLICFRVLHHSLYHSQRASRVNRPTSDEVLQRGLDLLHKRAVRIQDSAVKRIFLEQVAENRALLQHSHNRDHPLACI